MKLSEVGFVRCVICSKKLFGAFAGAEDFEINSAPIHDGTAVEWKIGYGSCFDGDGIVLGFCDKCMKQKLDEGSIRMFSNG